MGYRNTISSNVDKAFKLLKDLVVDVTLSSRSDTGFDFASNSAISVTTASKPIQAILISKTRPPSDKSSSTVQQSFLFKAKDISDPTIYDTITIVNGGSWKVKPPYQNDGFLVTADVTKEA